MFSSKLVFIMNHILIYKSKSIRLKVSKHRSLIYSAANVIDLYLTFIIFDESAPQGFEITVNLFCILVEAVEEFIKCQKMSVFIGRPQLL